MVSRHRPSTSAWQIERLASLLFALSRELRAGATVHGAVAAVATDRSVAGPDFRQLAGRVEAGAPVTDELDRWADRLGHPDAELVRAVLSLGVSTGSALAATLDRAAGRIVDRAELQREIRGLAAPARASALLLTIAPVGFLVLLATVDERVLVTIATVPVATGCVVAGLALNGVGWLWMRRLARSVER